MPYVSNEGVSIHYHVEGEGPSLVLQHGTSQSVEDWYSYGYVEGLREDNRLVLIDHRGHGRSDKPHDLGAYTLQVRVGDIVAVLDDLNILRAHYFGYSMGGWLGFVLAKYAPRRLESLIIGAGHPYERSFEAQREQLRRGVGAYVAAFESEMAEPISSEIKAHLLGNDVHALRALVQDRPNLEDVLPTMKMPCLVYAGESDQIYAEVERAANELPNGTFFSLPGLVHYEGFPRSDLVLPHVRNFLAQVSN